MTTDDAPSWQPTAQTGMLQARAALLAEIRRFFAVGKVLEVETPVRSRAGNSDPGIPQFQTKDGLWLRTSAEYPMKRLLAAGVGDCYELGRVFRAGETGAWHNPEFTMLEWYRVGWRYDELMDEVVNLISACSMRHGKHWSVRRYHYQDWFHEQLDLDALTASDEDLRRAAGAHGIDLTGLEALDHDGLLDLLVSHVVQPALPADTLTLVDRYPASQAALARLCDDDPNVAERFEVFLGPVELANGYGELTDAAEQRRRFEQENAKRLSEGATAVPLDEALLAALDSGLPECSGVALGVDRLLMVLTGALRIEDVLAFPANRA
ncbi:MAG: EF-P lysine aminoacylase EpmA [Pseudomonadota bacterium]